MPHPALVEVPRAPMI
ncbi:hypothetical protein E2C01_094321 [Portunus trituberculatus]|uniref:Uncharacterized protein n=1 Tax=Portunus trituberculatus TaxID=210409 RepID=A0A5B7JWU9_PORTR|nr:hypothetical protein [Portunus trituberculatus]